MKQAVIKIIKEDGQMDDIGYVGKLTYKEYKELQSSSDKLLVAAMRLTHCDKKLTLKEWELEKKKFSKGGK